MRIIRLGSKMLRFICPDCGTEFELNTNELKEKGWCRYSTQCPLCDKEIEVNDKELKDFLLRRKELGKDL